VKTRKTGEKKDLKSRSVLAARKTVKAPNPGSQGGSLIRWAS
jgi:hypothetical protein